MKGKEALSAARRRIADLEVQLADQAEKARRQADATHAELMQLRNRERELEGTLARNVAAIAEDRVQSVRDELEAERAAWAQARSAMAEATFAVLRDAGSELSSRGWILLAEIFGEGENFGMLVADETSNRQIRRASSKHARHIYELKDSGRVGDDMRKGPVPELDRR